MGTTDPCGGWGGKRFIKRGGPRELLQRGPKNSFERGTEKKKEKVQKGG